MRSLQGRGTAATARQGPAAQELCAHLDPKPVLSHSCPAGSARQGELRACPWAPVSCHTGPAPYCLILSQAPLLDHPSQLWGPLSKSASAVQAGAPQSLPGGRVTQFLQCLTRPQRTSKWFPMACQVLGSALSCLPHSPPTLPACLDGKGHPHSQVPPKPWGWCRGTDADKALPSLSGRVFTGEGQ